MDTWIFLSFYTITRLLARFLTQTTKHDISGVSNVIKIKNKKRKKKKSVSNELFSQ
jgi:hypothetical protein